MMHRHTIARSALLVPFVGTLACTPRTDSPTRETTTTVPPDDSSLPSTDDSSSDDFSTPVDDSSPPDDSSATSGDIEWTVVDSTDGPISYEWAYCYPDDDWPCSEKPLVCCGLEAGIIRSQHELTTLYADALPGVDYVPELDFSSHLVIWSYLRCCASLSEQLIVDDVTRVGTTLDLSMHIDRVKLAPALLGRPWVIVQVPIGDYDHVTYSVKK